MARRTVEKSENEYITKSQRAGGKTALSKKKKKIEEDDVFDLDKEFIIGMKNQVKNKQKNKPKKIKNKNEKIDLEKSKNQRKKTHKRKKEQGNKKSKNKRTSVKKTRVYTEQELEQIARRKKKIASITKKIFLFAMIITAIILFMMSPLFSITNIEVVGNEKISSQTIISLSGLQIEQNIFNIYKPQIEKAICEEPYIEMVDITRSLPSTIIINVKERQATFMLELGASYAYINNQGYILEISEQNINLPIIQGYQTLVENVAPGNRLEVDDLKKLEVVLKIMESAKNNELSTMITKINIENEYNYILILEGEGKTAYLGDASNINTRMLYLKEVVEREKGVRGDIFINQDVNSKRAVWREEV